jgi:diaminopimelate decarboxylase
MGETEDKKVIIGQAARYGSFFLLSEQKIADRARQLKKDFPNAEFLYSIRTDPAPGIVRCILHQGFGAAASSLNEVMLAHNLGVHPRRILYSAPGKSRRDIEEALDISTVVADSEQEIELIGQIAEARNTAAVIGLRINPDFTFTSGTGVPSKLGIDAALAMDKLPEWKSKHNIRLAGIQVSVREQMPDTEMLAKYYERVFTLAESFEEKAGDALDFLDPGCVIGVSCGTSDRPPDTAEAGLCEKEFADRFAEKSPGTRILLETGSHILENCGRFVTKVMDRKESMEKPLSFCTMHQAAFSVPATAQSMPVRRLQKRKRKK